MLVTNQTSSDLYFGPLHLAAGIGTTLTVDDTSGTSLYLTNDSVADALNNAYNSGQILVTSAAQPFPRPTGTPALLHGDGDPDGLVFAPQGSLYMRRDGAGSKERKKRREVKKAGGKNAPSAQAHPTQPRGVTEHDRGLLQPRPALRGRDGRKASHPTSRSLGEKGHPSPTRFDNRDGRSTHRTSSPPQRAHHASGEHAEALTRAIDRMLKHHDARQVVKEVRRWHPKWSKARVANLVVAQALPHWGVGKGAGQGKPRYQNVPYYRGQRPTAFALGRPVYKNPQRVPSLHEVAMAGYTKQELAWFAQSRKRNSPQFRADARWVAHHPAQTAAVLASIPEGGEALALIADALATYSAKRDLAHHHYSAAALDLAGVGAGRAAVREARLARSDAEAARKASRTVRAIDRAIEASPGHSSPAALQARLKVAVNEFRAARNDERSARDARALLARDARLAAYLAAIAEREEERKHRNR